jgi:hypothetical protein
MKTKHTIHTGTSFIYPAIGPLDTECLFERAKEQKLVLPTANQTIDLVVATLDNERKFRKVDDCINTGLVMNTACHYTPKGVYFEDLPKIGNNGLPVIKSEEDLIRKLEKNKRVRFVPYGYRTGDLTQKDFAENPFAIGLFGGRDKTESLARAAQHGFNYILLKGNPRDDLKIASTFPYISIALGYSADRVVVDADNLCRNSANSYVFALKEKQNGRNYN